MKKNKKKSLYKKSLRPFLNNNKVLLAALGGTAAGLLMSSLLGTEKAKQLLASIEGSFHDIHNRLMPKSNA